MPAVAVHGGSTSASVAGGGAPGFRNAAYLATLQDLLPPGPALTREPGAELTNLLEALSYEFARVERRGVDLIDELDPTMTDELLADWERVLGLPDEVVPTTDVGRRAAVHAKLLGNGDPTPAYFEAIAATLGYVAVVTSRPYRPFTCTSGCTDGIGWRWSYVWRLTTPSGTENALLQAVIDAVKPEHTICEFVFT